MEKEKIQKLVLNNTPLNPHGFLNLAPRSGKTKIAIDIIKRDKPKKILWVTPSSKLRDEDIPLEFKKWKALTYLKKTMIVTYSYLSKVKGDFDFVILDEYQDITENNSKGFFNGDISYNNILGLTGTPPKHEEKIDIFRNLNLKPIYNISIDEAVQKKIVSDYSINVVECLLDSKNKNIKVETKKTKFYTTEHAKYDYCSKVIRKVMFSGKPIPKFLYLNRMRAIHNSPTKLNVAEDLIKTLKGRKLIFGANIDQIEKLCKHTYHSKTDDSNLNKFLKEKIDVLGCVNSGGVGFTFKNVDHFIIIQANSNKKGDITQKIARSLLEQENYKASIYILSLVNTQDEKWVAKTLESFDENKIKYINYKNLWKQSH